MTARSLSRAKRAMSKYNLEPHEMTALLNHAHIVRAHLMWEMLKHAKKNNLPIYIHAVEAVEGNRTYGRMLGAAVRIKSLHPHKYEMRRASLSGVDYRNIDPTPLSSFISMDFRLEPCPAAIAHLLGARE